MSGNEQFQKKQKQETDIFLKAHLHEFLIWAAGGVYNADQKLYSKKNKNWFDTYRNLIVQDTDPSRKY